MDVEEQFAIELGRVNRLWRKRLDERLKQSGLTQARWMALMHLSRLGPVSQKDLAEAIGIERPTLVPVLDSLERQGLVERRACADDRRVKRVHLTEAAGLILTEIANIASELRAEILAHVERDDLSTTHNVLSEIGDRLESM